ncbi:BZ3500_MvSof-1268-A1-R1_Chr6-3g08771 [Microbotryum saponariae]|uniref:BZ3500_MvSof-1268-A1-R1_Chr6-3g08771 protein n=1 Tax=Microbotryum saponariae TaxID=289078 RepID=A0A2X0NHQ7_9BASI|nr:BZ3500_MvSof-1268-A1-R1_Chr6-3g08771 [Microbotryum saponariae]SDA07372.1 BZ3501_MvSof-1269-A2-R1_Chr6-2g08474 [Microbotryum saponariae]
MTELVSTFDRLSMHQHHGAHASIDASSSASPSSSSTNKKPAASSSHGTRLPTSSSNADNLAVPDMRRQRSQRFSVPTSQSDSSLAQQSQASVATSQAPPSQPSLPLSSSFAFQPAPAPVQAQSIPLSSYTLSELNGGLSAPPVQRSLSEDSFTHGLPYSDHHRYQSSGINASQSNPNLNGQYLNTQTSNHQTPPSSYQQAQQQQHQQQQQQQQQQQSSYRKLDYDFASMPNGAGGANMAPRFYGSAAPRHDAQSFASHRVDPSLDWLTRPPQQPPHAISHLHQQQHLHHQQSMAPLPGVGFDGTNYAGMMRGPPQDDEVIPTAIVIKNIPFQVPKEQLLGVMEDLRLPAPFAFNYHFDNGQFRGLAFANFRNASNASLCVSALNGFDLQGRKLRTEFKKVLKEGEKEKIEREKALKRMRSTRELHNGMGMGIGVGMTMGMGGGGFAPDGGPPPPPPPQVWMRREHSASDRAGFGNVAPINTDDDDYGRPVQGPYSSTFGGGASTFGAREYVPAPPPPPPGMNGGDGVWGRFNGSLPAGPTSSGSGPAPSSGQYSTSPPSDVGTSISARMTQTTSSSGSESGGGRSGSSGPIELDMNDSQTLDIYSRVVVFKDDFLREEFAFARSLSANQRKIVHLVAKKLELGHRSVGVGEDRHVVVYKPSASESPALRGMASSRALRHAASSLIRQPSRDTLNSYLNSTATSSTSYSNQAYSSGPMGSFTKSASTNVYSLHAKKSMPDIRPSNIHPGSRRSNMNLRHGYQSLQAPRPSRTYPPGVQSIFANQDYGNNEATPPVPSVPKEYYDSSGSNPSPNMHGNGGDPSPTSEESMSTGATSSIGGGGGLRTMSSKEEIGAWRRFDGHE